MVGTCDVDFEVEVDADVDVQLALLILVKVFQAMHIGLDRRFIARALCYAMLCHAMPCYTAAMSENEDGKRCLNPFQCCHLDAGAF